MTRPEIQQLPETQQMPQGLNRPVVLQSSLNQRGALGLSMGQGPIFHQTFTEAFQRWRSDTHQRIQAANLLQRSQQVESQVNAHVIPVSRGVGNEILRHITSLTNEAKKAENRFNPINLSYSVQRAEEYIVGMRRDPAIQILSSDAQRSIDDAMHIIETYKTILSDNRPALMNQTPRRQLPPELHSQLGTAGRLGALALIGLPFLGLAATSMLKGGERNSSLATMFGIATAGLLFGPQLFRTGTQQWIREVGPLAQLGGRYEYLRTTYNIQGNDWAQLAETLQRPLPSNVSSLLRKPTLTPEHITEIVTGLGLQNSPIRAQVEQMLQSSPRTLTEKPGEDFRWFRSIVRPSSDQARSFIVNYIRSGAGPQAITALHNLPPPPAPARPA